MTQDTKNIAEIIIEVINVFAVGFTAWFIYRSINSPVLAVERGSELNEQQNKDSLKRELFLTLFAYRGSPSHVEFVLALNKIEILFHDNKNVLEAWHKLFDSMQLPEGTKETEYHRKLWENNRIELLDEMSIALSYPPLKQLKIMQHYYPVGWEFQQNDDLSFRQSQRSYFEKQALLAQMLIDRMNDQDNDTKDETPSNF
ncbi:MAG: DUF6680 family protein [Ginsengibacter sp.]